MNLVERHIVINSKELEDLCFKSKNLYNQSLYYLRKSYFGEIERFSENELTGVFAEFDEENYRALPAQTSQQIIKSLFNNWKSYFRATKEFYKNPSKFNGKPVLPKYKKSQYGVYFAGQTIRNIDGFLHFPKGVIKPLKSKVEKVKQVRIIPQASCHVIEIVYEKQIKDLELNKENILSLDLGLSNLATSINNVGEKPFIINGNQLKSFNQWYNKRKAKLSSYLKGNRRTSRRISKLIHHRNCWIDDKLHKMSRFIVDYCIEHDIGKIIAGKNTGWKTGINLGTKNNQNFTIMPISRLLEKIKYKAELVGIEFICTEESYTSKCDALALETVEKHEDYLGKRKKRGLFQSSTGRLVNADGNGAMNIARKVIGDDFMKSLINSRCALQPYKVNIL
ncbi:MAG: transposase [Ignavibacteriae bacterium]|nr:transposase [Ignavibacteriota bacterium]